jgi:hypothetical protein
MNSEQAKNLLRAKSQVDFDRLSSNLEKIRELKRLGVKSSSPAAQPPVSPYTRVTMKR